MKRTFALFLIIVFSSFFAEAQCTLANYLAAVRIPIASYPYTALSAPTLTVSAINSGAPTLGNSSYSCDGNLFAGASPAWWLNGAAQSLTFNFTSPVTSLTFLINGTNATEVFYIVSNSTCAISLSNFCSVGYSSVGGTLTAGATAGLGSLITVNNPGGATQYVMTHNGLGAGSRVTLLDCFVKGTGTCVLPIELSEFTGNCNEKKSVDLNWKTSSERNNDYFSIERSRDTYTWQTIGEIDGAGNSSVLRSYSFTDNTPLKGIVYYRLKQTDLTKISTTSEIVTVNNCSDNNTNDVVIYPNPTSQNIIISGNEIENLTLFNSIGIEVLNIKVNQSEDLKINLAELPQGVYFLKIAEKNYKIIKE